MKNYKNYSVEDFVQDEAFRNWVRRTQPRDDDFWESWLTDNPDRVPIVEEARAIILAIQPVQPLVLSEKEVMNEVFSIMREVESLSHTSQPREQRWLYAFGIAASMAVIIAAFIWLAVGNTNNDAPVAGDLSTSRQAPVAMFIERVNEGEKPLLINLPDSSSVLLSQNSLIKYPRTFDKENRDVTFSGRAFFEVTKNPTRPFRIFTGDMMVKVLGTSFDVNTLDNPNEVKVTVKSGKVSIYARPDTSSSKYAATPSVVLVENEQAVINVTEKAIHHVRFDSGSDALNDVPETYMNARNTPVPDVLAALEKTYGVKISYTKEQLNGCSLTATFRDEPFVLKMDLICASIGVTYEMLNDTIIIKGIGCKP